MKSLKKTETPADIILCISKTFWILVFLKFEQAISLSVDVFCKKTQPLKNDGFVPWTQS